MAKILRNNLTPEERLKCLISYTKNVEIDPNVSAKLYYKSGLNMVEQFNIHYRERSWENAFCIYLKYELLFFDKIKKHPEYNNISVNIKSVNAANYRLIKPKAEHTKTELFKQYKREYLSYIGELRRNKEEAKLCGFDGKLAQFSTITNIKSDTSTLDTYGSDLMNSKTNSFKATPTRNLFCDTSEDLKPIIINLNEIEERNENGPRMSYMSTASRCSGKKKVRTSSMAEKIESKISFIAEKTFKESIDEDNLIHSKFKMLTNIREIK